MTTAATEYTPHYVLLRTRPRNYVSMDVAVGAAAYSPTNFFEWVYVVQQPWARFLVP